MLGSEINFNLKDAVLSNNCFDNNFVEEHGITYNKETQTFDLTLPTTQVTVGLTLLDGYAEKEVLDPSEERNASLVTSTLGAFLVKVNEDTDPNYVHDFIEALPAKDSRFLRELYPKMVPTVRLTHKFDCKRCYHQEELEVPLTARVFFGLSNDYVENVYEQFFFLKYHGGWSFIEAYNLPVGLRKWFVAKLVHQIKKKMRPKKANKIKPCVNAGLFIFCFDYLLRGDL